MIGLRGRSISRLVFADSDGVAHHIREVWANGVQVWDGRISVTIFANHGGMGWWGSGSTVSTDVFVDAVDVACSRLTGGGAVVENSVTVVTSGGMYSFTGDDADLILDTVVFATGEPNTDWVGRHITPAITYGAFFDPGSMEFSAPDAVLSLDVIVESSLAAFFSLEGQDALVHVDAPVDAVTFGSAEFDGADAVVSTTIGVDASGGVSVWSSVSGVVSSSNVVSAGSGLFDVVGGSVEPVIKYFDQQRMVLNQLWNSPSNRNIVSGWSPDVTHPATIVSNKLTVVGSIDSATITAHLVPEMVGSPQSDGTAYLMHNGIAVASQAFPQFSPPGPIDLVATSAVAAGDTIWLEVNSGFFGSLNLKAGTYIDVTS